MQNKTNMFTNKINMNPMIFNYKNNVDKNIYINIILCERWRILQNCQREILRLIDKLSKRDPTSQR